MDIITSLEGLAYVDKQLNKFQESGRLFGETTAGSLVGAKKCSHARGTSAAAAWSDQKIPEEILPQRQEALDSDQQARSQQRTLDWSPQSGERSDSSSQCSAVSSSTTLSEAAHKAHERSQFAKLLSPKTDEKPALQNAGKGSLWSSVRKSLRRKLPTSDIQGAVIVACTNDTDEASEEGSSGEVNERTSDKSSDPTTSALSKKGADQHPNNKDRGDLLEACSRKRVVPEGYRLAETQLALQENILSDIADRAIGEVRRGSNSRKAKQRSSPIGSEEEPEDLDRELEVTQELMKQLRNSLNDGSYRDMYLVDDKGKEESMDEKYAVLCDILLMLRRVFRDILAKFERVYRPTGFPVADREMVKEMDEQLLARKNLMRRYPLMTIEEMLESLGRIEHEASLKTLAGL